MFRAVNLEPMAPGCLLLHSMPGRWETLIEFQTGAQQEGIDRIVVLTSDEEIVRKSPGYLAWLNDNPLGLEISRFLIEDYSTPDDIGAFQALVASIARDLRAGRTVLVHCGAGVGRTGTTAVCVLRELGFESFESQSRVEDAHAGPETEGQKSLLDALFCGLNRDHAMMPSSKARRFVAVDLSSLCPRVLTAGNGPDGRLRVSGAMTCANRDELQAFLQTLTFSIDHLFIVAATTDSRLLALGPSPGLRSPLPDPAAPCDAIDRFLEAPLAAAVAMTDRPLREDGCLAIHQHENLLHFALIARGAPIAHGTLPASTPEHDALDRVRRRLADWDLAAAGLPAVLSADPGAFPTLADATRCAFRCAVLPFQPPLWLDPHLRATPWRIASGLLCEAL